MTYGDRSDHGPRSTTSEPGTSSGPRKALDRGCRGSREATWCQQGEQPAFGAAERPACGASSDGGEKRAAEA
jgi:hypothetical protein